MPLVFARESDGACSSRNYHSPPRSNHHRLARARSGVGQHLPRARPLRRRGDEPALFARLRAGHRNAAGIHRRGRRCHPLRRCGGRRPARIGDRHRPARRGGRKEPGRQSAVARRAAGCRDGAARDAQADQPSDRQGDRTGRDHPLGTAGPSGAANRRRHRGIALRRHPRDDRLRRRARRTLGEAHAFGSHAQPARCHRDGHAKLPCRQFRLAGQLRRDAGR